MLELQDCCRCTSGGSTFVCKPESSNRVGTVIHCVNKQFTCSIINYHSRGYEEEKEYLVKQVASFDEFLYNEQTPRILFIIIIIFAYAIARSNIPARSIGAEWLSTDKCGIIDR
jgi:hypothetical protein